VPTVRGVVSLPPAGVWVLPTGLKLLTLPKSGGVVELLNRDLGISNDLSFSCTHCVCGQKNTSGL
jgi:hypothetical protein